MPAGNETDEHKVEWYDEEIQRRQALLQQEEKDKQSRVKVVPI
jgi:hypothetical protein